MTTFGLLHGASGSGAMWAPIALALEAKGHRVVAPDLPIEDRQATFADYAAAVREAVGDDDAVLVGHSLGGCTIRRLPARRHVYLAAMLPEPGRTLAEQLKTERMLLPAVAKAHIKWADGLYRWDTGLVFDLLFHDAPPGAGAKALPHLRGQSVAPWFERCPEDLPDVPATYIVCADDRVVSPEWGREAAPRLVGADVVELPSGHIPQLAQPRRLADLLLAHAD